MMSPYYNRNIFPPNPHYFQSLEGDFRGPGTTENSKSLTIAKFRLTKVHSTLGSLHVMDLCTFGGRNYTFMNFRGPGTLVQIK